MSYRSYYDFRILKDGKELSLPDEVNDFIFKSEGEDIGDLQCAVQGQEMGSYFSPDTLMTGISNQFPETTFVVYRSGEDSTDMDISYYEKGNVYTGDVIIKYPTLDELKRKNDAV